MVFTGFLTFFSSFPFGGGSGSGVVIFFGGVCAACFFYLYFLSGFGVFLFTHIYIMTQMKQEI